MVSHCSFDLHIPDSWWLLILFACNIVLPCVMYHNKQSNFLQSFALWWAYWLVWEINSQTKNISLIQWFIWTGHSRSRKERETHSNWEVKDLKEGWVWKGYLGIGIRAFEKAEKLPRACMSKEILFSCSGFTVLIILHVSYLWKWILSFTANCYFS